MRESRGKIVQTVKGAQEGGLATSGGSDDRQALMREDLEVETFHGWLTVEGSREALGAKGGRGSLHGYRPTLTANRRISA
jgi:hypothetical protein